MKVLYSPQLNLKDKIIYSFQGETITATLNGTSDTFDFSALPDGRAYDIRTSLPVNPICDAIRENGVLSVILLNYIDENADENERFPQWMEV
jgi:hypothetical protein